MKILNFCFRLAIHSLVVMIMILSLPVKLFTMFFEWREEKQMATRGKNQKQVEIEHSKFYS
jgi:hypothetical protein